MSVERFYSSAAVRGRALQRAAQLYPQLSITTETCYNVELTGETICQDPETILFKLFTYLFTYVLFQLSLPTPHAPGGEALSSPDRAVLTWLFQSPMQTEALSPEPFLVPQAGQRLVEIGPRYHIS